MSHFICVLMYINNAIPLTLTEPSQENCFVFKRLFYTGASHKCHHAINMMHIILMHIILAIFGSSNKLNTLWPNPPSTSPCTYIKTHSPKRIQKKTVTWQLSKTDISHVSQTPAYCQWMNTGMMVKFQLLTSICTSFLYSKTPFSRLSSGFWFNAECFHIKSGRRKMRFKEVSPQWLNFFFIWI